MPVAGIRGVQGIAPVARGLDGTGQVLRPCVARIGYSSAGAVGRAPPRRGSGLATLTL